MIGWIIVIAGIIAIYLVSKLTHFKHKMSLLTIIVIFLLIALTFINVVSNNSINLKSPSGILAATQVYFSWLGQVLGNVKVITGNVIRMDWSGNLTG